MLARFAVVVFLLAPTVGAQLSLKDARDELKDATKEVSEEFRDAVKVATSNGTAAIKAFTQQVKSEGFSSEELFDLFDDLAAVQTAIRLAYDAAQDDLAIGSQQILEEFMADQDESDGFPEHPIIPRLFEEKDRGILGKARADLRKRTEKSASKLESALRKAAQVVEDQANVSISYVVEPVRPLFVRTFGLTASSLIESEIFGETITIDLALAFRDLAEPPTLGRVFAGGTAVGGNVGLRMKATGVGSTLAGIEPDASARWQGNQDTPGANLLLTVFYQEDTSGGRGVDTVIVGSR